MPVHTDHSSDMHIYCIDLRTGATHTAGKRLGDGEVQMDRSRREEVVMSNVGPYGKHTLEPNHLTTG